MRTRQLQRTTWRLVALIVLTTLVLTFNADAINSDKYSINLDNDIYEAQRLVSHDITTHTVGTAFTCYKVCLDNCLCVSFNYCANERKCELKSARKRDDPDNYVPDENCKYHEITWKERESQCNVS